MAPSRHFGKRTTALEILEGMELRGRTFFITEGDSSKGFQTARALALHNAHVVIGCRSIVRGLEAKGDILTEKRDSKIDVLQLDNFDLQSVKECAEKYIAKGWPLHCLILNARVYKPLHRVTDDEFETTFQVNHLAHFFLVKLLIPLLITSAPSRIVVLSSSRHKSIGTIGVGPHDITWQRLSPTHHHSLNSVMVAYNLSKLCNILFAKALHERLKQQNITVNSVNAGRIKKSNDDENGSTPFQSCMPVVNPWLKTAEQSASTIVYCAVWPDLTPETGGAYFENCHATSPSASSRKLEMAERLWDLSELMIEMYQEKFQRTCAKLESSGIELTPSQIELQPILEDGEKTLTE